MSRAYIVDGLRTPIGKYAGSLSGVRPDDLAARVLAALVRRHPQIDGSEVDDVILGCANQAGEDNRNVARMALLLAGMPDSVSGTTINRLCGSGADAVGTAARSIRAGEADLVIAGGVESMSRAPFVMAKPDTPFSRNPQIYDTTMGWRFINKALEASYGTDSMGQTAENVAVEQMVSREDQDQFALRSQERASRARARGLFDEEITSISIPGGRSGPSEVVEDEHLRSTDLDALAALPPAFCRDGTVTAGNSSGINDGAAAMLLASESAVEQFNLSPFAHVVSVATAGVPPRVMGLGPVPATRKLLGRVGLTITDIDLIELNEAFAAQALAVLRQFGLRDDAEHVNPNGGAIALGHPLGMSGARLVLTAARELERRQTHTAVATMCIGVGQGIAVLLERTP